jgi:hypothetical protein
MKVSHNLLSNPSRTLLSLCLGWVALSAAPAAAASIDYAFELNFDFGPQAGNTYSGSFQYLDNTLTGSGDEYVPLTQFTLDLDGTTYTLASLDTSDAAFYDGTFLGLEAASNSFAFIPGFEDTSDAYFTADDFGLGDTHYERTPEPLTILGSLAALGVGAALKRKMGSV